ncbi:MAG: glucosaminidase domain-containing protein [Holosporaceae bacterium]|jgi:Bax protein|nr:glucosaminidase domain-containing protein [Holosporaceae bacterium]
MIFRLFVPVCLILFIATLHNINRGILEQSCKSYVAEREVSATSQVSPSTQPAVKRSSNIRDEIFLCHKIDKFLDAQYHKILRKVNLDKVPNFALTGIPLINSAAKSDRDFFVRAIASAVGKANEIVKEQRKFVFYIQEKQRKSQKLTPSESERFRKICRFYQTRDFSELLLRVAPVPVSLAVAQATLESKFGSNPTIHRRNAYFGLMESNTNLLKFDNLFNCVIAYMKTLNVRNCYHEFRKRREIMMKESSKIDGVKLSSFIRDYGTDKNYQKLVLQIIKRHRLEILDQKT